MRCRRWSCYWSYGAFTSIRNYHSVLLIILALDLCCKILDVQKIEIGTLLFVIVFVIETIILMQLLEIYTWSCRQLAIHHEDDKTLQNFLLAYNA